MDVDGCSLGNAMNLFGRWIAFAVIIGTGCEAAKTAEGNSRPVAMEVSPAAGVVDSILPIEEELRRFRGTLAEHPAQLREGAQSRDQLVQRFVRALESRDTAELRRLVLSRSEFAWFYYPESHFARPPYELSPQLVWMQMEHSSMNGLSRALQRLGGKPLQYRDYECRPEAAREGGSNRLWTDCTLRLAGGQRLGLFGSVIERDGTFKFVSYANAL